VGTAGCIADVAGKGNRLLVGHSNDLGLYLISAGSDEALRPFTLGSSEFDTRAIKLWGRDAERRLPAGRLAGLAAFTPSSAVARFPPHPILGIRRNHNFANVFWHAPHHTVELTEPPVAGLPEHFVFAGPAAIGENPVDLLESIQGHLSVAGGSATVCRVGWLVLGHESDWPIWRR
jgi:hypothetical protein